VGVPIRRDAPASQTSHFDEYANDIQCQASTEKIAEGKIGGALVRGYLACPIQMTTLQSRRKPDEYGYLSLATR
jgi:hypothetical protein